MSEPLQTLGPTEAPPTPHTVLATTEADLSEIESFVSNNFKCSICQEIVIMAQSLSCSHCFCTSCIDEWVVNGHRECPVCREVIRNRLSLLGINRAIEDYFKLQTVEEREARSALIASREEQVLRIVQERVQQQTGQGSGIGSTMMGVNVARVRRRVRRRRRRRVLTTWTGNRATVRALRGIEIPGAQHTPGG